MGLDMYAFAAPKSAVTQEVGFKLAELPDLHEIHTWRKHPDLHGWMAKLYYDKGGVGEFNCQPMVLNERDIDTLEQIIRDRSLPTTGGFFFGASYGSELEDDLAFIAAARKAMTCGYAVIYDSWW